MSEVLDTTATIERLTKHREYHTPADPACLTCQAARLVTELTGDTEGIRTRLSAMVATAQHASEQLGVVLDLLGRDDGPAVRAALHSIAGETPGDALKALRSRQQEQVWTDQERLEQATERLERIAAAHTQMVGQLQATRNRRARAQLALLIRHLATAWYGHETRTPQDPLTLT